LRKYDDLFELTEYLDWSAASIPSAALMWFGSLSHFFIWTSAFFLCGIFLKMIYEMMRHALAFTIDTILLYKQKRFQKKFNIECQYYADKKRESWSKADFILTNSEWPLTRRKK